MAGGKAYVSMKHDSYQSDLNLKVYSHTARRIMKSHFIPLVTKLTDIYAACSKDAVLGAFEKLFTNKTPSVLARLMPHTLL